MKDNQKEWLVKSFNDFQQHDLKESVPKLNTAFTKFRSIYQGGKRYNAKEGLKIISNLLDEID